MFPTRVGVDRLFAPGESADPRMLLDAVLEMAARYGGATAAEEPATTVPVKREDLRLICFDVVSC